MRSPVVLSSGSPEQTYTWGTVLGTLLGRGDVLALVGELGAGKTTFTQGIVRGLGVAEDHYIGSPTFTLINEYEGRVPVYHLDFYRIESPSEVVHLGLEEYLDGDGVAIIEWADKIAALLPEEHMMVRLAYVDCSVRTLDIMGTGAHYDEVVASLARKVSFGTGPVTGCIQ
jgi:tRNA threonylcarbamoyladenosine biosynthesis protein TsaE